MKKSYSFIIITFLVMFFISINKVSAAVYGADIFTPSSTQDSTYFDVSGRSYTLRFENTIFNNDGTGNIIFNVVQASTGGTTNVVYTYEIGGASASYTCTASGGTWYVDNDTQRLLQTITCPYNSDYNNGAKYLYVHRDSNSGTSRVYIPYRFTFVSDNETDVSAIVNGLDDLSDTLVSTLNGNTNSILASLSSLWNKSESNTQSIINRLEAINSFLNTMQTAQINAINQNTQAVQDQTDTIKSENVSGAESSASDLVNNSDFQDNTGLTGIISMPLTFVNNLGSTCQPIFLTIPYMDYTFTIPCFQSIVNNYMPALVVVLKVIVNGLIIYWVMLDIFHIVKSAKNPEDDRIEVLDL